MGKNRFFQQLIQCDIECHLNIKHFRWVPVTFKRSEKPDIRVMSIAFLLRGNDTAIIWRGPKKNAMINQFLVDVDWGELDYLLIDTPPGTSDEHISVVEGVQNFRNPDGVILVTTPQVKYLTIIHY